MKPVNKTLLNRIHKTIDASSRLIRAIEPGTLAAMKSEEFVAYSEFHRQVIELEKLVIAQSKKLPKGVQKQ